MESPPPSSDLDFAEFFDPSKPFQGIVICCTSIPAHERTDLAKKLAELGGRHEYDLTPQTTHLVVGEYDTTKYRHVAKQRPDIRIMALGWVDAVRDLWVKDDPINFRALEITWTLKPFETGGGTRTQDGKMGEATRLICCVSGFEEDARASLIQQIKTHGGIYTGNLDRSCTHLIVREPTGKKYLAARKWNQHIVVKQWVDDSVRRGMILDETCYDPHLPIQDIGKDAWVKRDLRRKSLGKRLREAAEGHGEGGPRRKLRKTASIKLNSQRDNMWGEILGQKPSADLSAMSFQSEVPTQPLPNESMMGQSREMSAHRTSEVGDSFGVAKETAEDVFTSCAFYISNFSSTQFNIMMPFITSRGGTVVASLSELCPSPSMPRCFLVVPQHSHPASHPQVADGVETVTEFFIEKCIYKKGTALPDPRAHVIGRPFPVFPIQGFDQLSISTSGFLDIELNQIEKVVRQLGASYAERFTATCSLLICTSLNGARKQKLQMALTWGVPIVKVEWLWDCITTGQKLATRDYVFPELKSRAAERAQFAKPLSRSKSVSDAPKRLITTTKGLGPRSESTASRSAIQGPDMSAFNNSPLVATESPWPTNTGKGSTKEPLATGDFRTALTHQGTEQALSQQQQQPYTEPLTERSASDLNKGSPKEESLPSRPSPRKPLARVRSEICDSEAGDDDDDDDDDGLIRPQEEDHTGKSATTTRAATAERSPNKIENEKKMQREAEKAAAERQALSSRLTSLLEISAVNASNNSFESNASHGAVGGGGLDYSNAAGVTDSAAAASTTTMTAPGQQPSHRRKRSLIGRVISNASAASTNSEDSCVTTTNMNNNNTNTGKHKPLARTHSAVVSTSAAMLHEVDDNNTASQDAERAPTLPTSTQLQYDDPDATRSKQRLMSKMLGREASSTTTTTSGPDGGDHGSGGGEGRELTLGAMGAMMLEHEAAVAAAGGGVGARRTSGRVTRRRW
ncbi:BRCT domain-containing protein [Coniella lustricola]|uniref:BRCT domain-containing protein n=1 Tax=Coniella lustricola TaxID=2025994 RepID=A0A2T2ZTS2_9PEZI|nr:BRCT domain-containing protein [Coniella lustricola]